MAPGLGGRLGRLGGWSGEGLRPCPGPASAAMRPARTALCLRLTLALGLAPAGLMAVGGPQPQPPSMSAAGQCGCPRVTRRSDRLARKFGFVNLGQVGGTQIIRRWKM